MKLSARHSIVEKARIDIQEAVTASVGKNAELTHAELNHILLQIALSWSTWAIKDERGADPFGGPTAAP